MTPQTSALDQIVSDLVQSGATFIAIDEESLDKKAPRLLYHTPAGTSDEQHVAINRTLRNHDFNDRGVGHATVTGSTMPMQVQHVLHDALYTYSRVAVFVTDGIPGLDSVTLEEGLENVRSFIEGEADPDPKRSDTIELKDLVSNLAAAGAASVEAERRSLDREDPLLNLRIPIVPAKGAPEIVPYDAVDVDGETYELTFVLTLDGPAPGLRLPLFVAESVHGAEPVPIEKGLTRIEEKLSEAPSERVK